MLYGQAKYEMLNEYEIRFIVYADAFSPKLVLKQLEVAARRSDMTPAHLEYQMLI